MSANRCDSCQAPVRWLKTATGKWIPVNPSTVQPADTLFDPTKHVSHFAECPNADQHRRPRK